MTTESLQLSFLSTKNPKEAFNAIANFRGWWSEQIEGNTDKLGETFFYHYLDVHLCKIKLIEMIPDQKLVYHVVDNHFSFTKDEKEWTDTKIIFEIETVGDKTKVSLTHEGLNASHECFNICHESWTNYFHKSLLNLIEMGKGNPNPLEGEGFNAAVVEKWKLK